MTWAIKKDWGFVAVEVLKETDKMVFYNDRWGGGLREARSGKDKFLDWRGDEDTARALVAKLTSAEAEYNRRCSAASDWYAKRKATILAQGMAPEGRGREGGPGSSELPGPVGTADAPKGD